MQVALHPAGSADITRIRRIAAGRARVSLDRGPTTDLPDAAGNKDVQRIEATARGDADNEDRRRVGLLGQTKGVKPSERYAQHATLLMDFRNAYVELLNRAEPKGDGWSIQALGPKTSVDWTTWSRLRSNVARAAGAASTVYHRYGGTFVLRNVAYIMNDVDPVVNWEMSLSDPEQLKPEVVISTVEGATALAFQKAKEAEGREHGITGLIAAFLRWPSDLREAVGPDHAGQRAAAGAIGLLGQIVVTAIGGAITVGIVAGAVALWGLAF